MKGEFEMTECIAMVIGVILGAAVAILSKAEFPEKKTETTEANDAVLAREAINKQLENFFNYDGTANGQKSLGDDD